MPYHSVCVSKCDKTYDSNIPFQNLVISTYLYRTHLAYKYFRQVCSQTDGYRPHFVVYREKYVYLWLQTQYRTQFTHNMLISFFFSITCMRVCIYCKTRQSTWTWLFISSCVHAVLRDSTLLLFSYDKTITKQTCYQPIHKYVTAANSSIHR